MSMAPVLVVEVLPAPDGVDEEDIAALPLWLPDFVVALAWLCARSIAC
jgi:hypothetical protein